MQNVQLSVFDLVDGSGCVLEATAALHAFRAAILLRPFDVFARVARTSLANEYLIEQRATMRAVSAAGARVARLRVAR